MAKLVIKTVFITIATIVVMAGIAILCLFSLTPKTLGSFFDGIGNYSAAVYFYEKQYNKTQSLDDLFVLVEKVDEHADYTKTEKYSSKLVENSGFNTFCESKNREKNNKITTQEFVLGKLAVSTFLSKGISCAIDRCNQAISLTGYTENSAYSILILDLSIRFTDEQLNQISEAISNISDLSPTEQAVANLDISFINERMTTN